MKTVAVIDDNLIIQIHLKKMLQSQENIREVFAFSSVEDALEHLSNKEFITEIPDVIFLDINFPGQDGWDFLAEFDKIKHYYNKLPAIYLISSSIMDSDKERSVKNELIQGYITKPFTENQVLSISQLKSS